MGAIVMVVTFSKVAMEFMGAGCLTEVLDQYDHVQMTEPHIANVCRNVSCIVMMLTYMF